MNSVYDWATGLFPAGGYFVEAGAHDGVGDSQTLELERGGDWWGLCVEPSSAFDGLLKNRRCSVDVRCLSGVDGEQITYREVLGDAVELSGLVRCFNDHWYRETRPHRDVTLKTVSLATMLKDHKAPNVIELLCLDTEGSELEILSQHPFIQYRFRAIQVEHNGVGSRKVELRRLLERERYEYVDTDDINDRYVWSK